MRDSDIFIDEAKLTVRAGKGGDGRVSFRREKFAPRGGPDGGDGGRGGDVVLLADRNRSTLREQQHRPEVRAENGHDGSVRNKAGPAGEDLIITPEHVRQQIAVIEECHRQNPLSQLAK